MAWTVELESPTSGEADMGIVLAEEVPFTSPKTLIWGSNAANGVGSTLVGGLADRALELQGVRFILGTTVTSGSRRPKIQILNTAGSVIAEFVSNLTTATSIVAQYEFGSSGAAGAAAGTLNFDRAYFPCLLLPGHSLVIGAHDGTSEINTITANAVPATAGTFTLTVNGQTTAPIAFDATAAVIYAALLALSNVMPGDVHVTFTTGTNLGTASAVVRLAWAGNLGARDITITIDTTLLTGNAHALATPTAGVGPIDLTDTVIAYVRGRLV